MGLNQENNKFNYYYGYLARCVMPNRHCTDNKSNYYYGQMCQNK